MGSTGKKHIKGKRKGSQGKEAKQRHGKDGRQAGIEWDGMVGKERDGTIHGWADGEMGNE